MPDNGEGAKPGQGETGEAGQQREGQAGAKGSQISAEQQQRLAAIFQTFLQAPEDAKKPLLFHESISPLERIIILENLPPEQQQTFLATLTEEEMQKIAQDQEEVVESRVTEVRADDGRSAAEKAAGLDPDMPESEKQTHDSLSALISGHVTAGGGLTNESNVKVALEASHMSKEDAAAFLNGQQVTDQGTTERLTENLRSAEEEDRETEETSPLKAKEIEITGKALPEALDQMGEDLGGLEEVVDAREDMTNEEKRLLKRDIAARRAKISRNIGNLRFKLTDFFAEGEPGRKYARIGGKVLYFAILTAFVTLLIEMNLINRMARSSGGRR